MFQLVLIWEKLLNCCSVPLLCAASQIEKNTGALIYTVHVSAVVQMSEQSSLLTVWYYWSEQNAITLFFFIFLT